MSSFFCFFLSLFFHFLIFVLFFFDFVSFFKNNIDPKKYVCCGGPLLCPAVV